MKNIATNLRVSTLFSVLLFILIGLNTMPVLANTVKLDKKVKIKQAKQSSNRLKCLKIRKEDVTEGAYTLGKDDVIEIMVRRHPEFSGTFPVGPNGKIQYPFIGDIQLSGFTKAKAVAKLNQILSKYIANPELDITISEYNSKVVYVVGSIARPGRYSMRSEFMPVRDAVIAAGLPRENIASLRRAIIIRPIENGKTITRKVNLLSLLYDGNLKLNYYLRSGDIVYLPSTALYKISTIMDQMISPLFRSSAAYNTYEEDVLYRDNPRRQ